MPVIGYISGGGPTGPLRAAFQQGLGETGYVEGQNLAVERRFAEGTMINCPHSPPISSIARST
jgi:putative ABC transport system substrate-binding protein